MTWDTPGEIGKEHSQSGGRPGPLVVSGCARASVSDTLPRPRCSSREAGAALRDHPGRMPEPVQQPEDVGALIARARGWATRRSDVRGLALVGSWARGDADQDSDVDLVVLVDEPGNLLRDDAWTTELGATSVLRTKSWGALTERRLALPSGLEVDVGIASVSWATTSPVDGGTRQVASAGISVLFDPDGLLAELIAAITR